MNRVVAWTLGLACWVGPAAAQEAETLPGTEPLTWTGDLSEKMLAGLHRDVEQRIAESLQRRERHWKRDFTSREAYEKSVEPNRRRLMKYLGVVDPRLPARMERFGEEAKAGLVAEGQGYTVWQVRWPVLEGVFGEGLLLEPGREPVARAVVLPDADQVPEQLVGLAPGVEPESQIARRLAENGFQVLVPLLISRDCEASGNPLVAMTNQPHREWIYRQAYHMGRHIIGYEVQKVLAAVDWFETSPQQLPIGVAAYGEGGLVGLHAAALDPRIKAACISGYFTAHERLWEEPIYRNIWGLLDEFGDAELATLVAPRGLVIEYSQSPRVDGPPAQAEGRRGGAAAGRLETPPLASVTAEFERIAALLEPDFQTRFLVTATDGGTLAAGSPQALEAWASLLGRQGSLPLSQTIPDDRRQSFDPARRQHRQVRELEQHVQALLDRSERTRNAFFLDNTSLMRGLESRGQRFGMYRVAERSADEFQREANPYRDYLWQEVLGKLPDPTTAANPRTRKVYDTPHYTGYEVVLDVYPEVFAWGILLVPKDLEPGQRRPVVVCQHGRNGLPRDTIETDVDGYKHYRALAARLAERGFVTFSPHNLYRGEDVYRYLDRKANSIKASMFSYITVQHQQILAWLGTLGFVDPERIAFYGLSYGGETAVRLPPILPGYCLSICSGDFNDWARKVVSINNDYSFMFTVEWEMPYFDMGNTFNYAELAALIVPRPFMVERGHHDGVAPDEWVAYEYAQVRWLYTMLGLGDKTSIEFFNGGHVINAEGTFDFLHRHLAWPPPRD